VKRILVVITPDSSVESLRSFLQDWNLRVQEESELKILLFVDDELPSSVSSWLMYVGFLGAKIENEMKKAIVEELINRGREILLEEEKILKEIAVNYTVDEVVGTVDEVKKKIGDYKPNRIFVSGIDPSKFHGFKVEVIQ